MSFFFPMNRKATALCHASAPRRGPRSYSMLGLVAFTCLAALDTRAGVTLITHGLGGSVSGWVTAMADRIPAYNTFPGTNYTCYKTYFYPSGNSYYLAATRTAGVHPLLAESGEIVITFDWSDLADGNSYNTYQVAAAALPALLSTNFIPELGGHALAEFPLHLIGHSRGGSLVCEISRLLGTNGVWVDHLTTLDPHPLNNDGFNLDSFLYSAVDAPARTYENVLFHDNYWQDLDFFAKGEPVSGAYVRRLTSLGGGYSSEHSDAHLWYHGTIQTSTPANDTEAAISSTQRANWWVAAEAQGSLAGYHYSRIGRGDRRSFDRPTGAGQPAIRDGYNQHWNLGAGLAANRTLLGSYQGSWPSLIEVNRDATNAVFQGQTTPVRFFYQYARAQGSPATISFFLDADLNPLNGNEQLLSTMDAPVTGAAALGSGAIQMPISTNAAPGWHAILATISVPEGQRHLYAPELIEVLPATAPTVSIGRVANGSYRLTIAGQPGQTLVVQSASSVSAQTWESLATNTLITTAWTWTNTPPTEGESRFYRVMVAP